MPIFEYLCQSCDEEFELIVNRSTEPTCPHCESQKLEKRLSVFASNKPDHLHTGPGCGCGNPQGPCNN